MQPSYYWKLRKQDIEDNKICDSISGDYPLELGKDVGKIEDFGVVLNKKTMQSGLTFPAKFSKYFGTNPLTVSIWFATDSDSSNSTLFGNRSAGSHGDFFCIRYARKKICAEFDANGVLYAPLSSETIVGDGEWHQVTVTRDGCSHKLYIDGKLVSSKDTENPIDLNRNSSDLYRLGICPISNVYNLYFTGKIGDVCFYEEALDEDKIQENFVLPTLKRAKSARK